MIDSLFSTDENNKVIIHPEALFIPEFKKLINRTRARQRALTEIAYIYHYVAYNSPYAAYSPAKRAVQLGVDLFDDEKYKPDEDMFSAMSRYDDMQKTPSLNALTSITEALDTSAKVIVEMRLSIENELAEVRASEKEQDKDINIKRCIAHIKSIIDLSKSIPDTIDRVKKLEDNVKSEQQKKITAKGGYDLSKREDPNYVNKFKDPFKY